MGLVWTGPLCLSCIWRRGCFQGLGGNGIAGQQQCKISSSICRLWMTKASVFGLSGRICLAISTNLLPSACRTYQAFSKTTASQRSSQTGGRSCTCIWATLQGILVVGWSEGARILVEWLQGSEVPSELRRMLQRTSCKMHEHSSKRMASGLSHDKCIFNLAM